MILSGTGLYIIGGQMLNNRQIWLWSRLNLRSFQTHKKRAGFFQPFGKLLICKLQKLIDYDFRDKVSLVTLQFNNIDTVREIVPDNSCKVICIQNHSACYIIHLK